MPTVSVIIPAYNCAIYLVEAIESVFAQTYTDWEVIVVDDGSTDHTAEVVAPYLERIRYIHQANKGLPAARNTGIRAASGEFIALLDADDAWLPEKLQLQMPSFQDPEVGIVYTDFAVRYADGRFLESYLAQRPLASEGYVAENYLRSRFLFPSSMVLRRAAMDACGLFDEEMIASEDIELFARICLRWKVVRVNRPLMIRTESSHNITANSSRMNDYTILAFEKVLAREPGMPRSTREVLHGELARQLWWRGYALFQTGQAVEARADLWRAFRYDASYGRPALLRWAASWLPSGLLKRLLGFRTKTPA